MRAQLAEALGAHAAQDDEALLEAVHRLKNTAGDIGATRLHGAAAMWEKAIKAGGVPGQGMAGLEQAGREAVAAAEDLQDRGTQA